MVAITAPIFTSGIRPIWITLVLSFDLGQKWHVKDVRMGKTMGSLFVIEKIMGYHYLIKKVPGPSIAYAPPGGGKQGLHWIIELVAAH